MAAREQAALYRQMVETTSQLVPVILDDSSLILDSELHTYYLMNVTGPLLLQAQAAVAEAGSVASKAKAEGRSLDPRDLSQLHAQSGALVNTIIPRMRYSLETALREDKHPARRWLLFSEECSSLVRALRRTDLRPLFVDQPPGGGNRCRLGAGPDC